MTTFDPAENRLVQQSKRGSASAALLAEAQREAIALGLGAPVAIRVNPRARRLLLRVDSVAREVQLVLPHGVLPRRGVEFLARHRGWIEGRLGALPPPVPFVAGAVVPIFGVPHRILHESDAGAPPVAIRDGEIRVRGEPDHIGRRVRDHLVALARRELARRARLCAARIDKKVLRVGVRDTKSRWGSCSTQGALSFSWRLVLAPEAVVDYVVAHEVAHLVEMNHGPRFWRLVQSLLPGDMMPQRRWLKTHRNRLMAYG